MARTGRPKGTEIVDTHILKRMARERLKHPELKIQTLARQFEEMAEGASSVARYRRLAGKFKKREAELMAWAKEQPAD